MLYIIANYILYSCAYNDHLQFILVWNITKSQIYIGMFDVGPAMFWKPEGLW